MEVLVLFGSFKKRVLVRFGFGSIPISIRHTQGCWRSSYSGVAPVDRASIKRQPLSTTPAEEWLGCSAGRWQITRIYFISVKCIHRATLLLPTASIAVEWVRSLHAIVTTILLRFDVRSTAVRLLIKGH